jgi:hypothetical protein
MPKFVIEREIPGLGDFTPEQMQQTAEKSNRILAELGPEISWLTSYATGDKMYCVYWAPDEDIIYEHARCGGFPANRVSKVSAVIDPSTGDKA